MLVIRLSARSVLSAPRRVLNYPDNMNTDALHAPQITNYCRILPLNMRNFNLPDGVKMPEYPEGPRLLGNHSECAPLEGRQ